LNSSCLDPSFLEWRLGCKTCILYTGLKFKWNNIYSIFLIQVLSGQKNYLTGFFSNHGAEISGETDTSLNRYTGYKFCIQVSIQENLDQENLNSSLCIHDARNFDEYTQVWAGDTTNKMAFLGGEEGASLCIALL
jgi:hypothetical protein